MSVTVRDLLLARSPDSRPASSSRTVVDVGRGRPGVCGPAAVLDVLPPTGARPTSACCSTTPSSVPARRRRARRQVWSGLNTTRRGEALAADVARADCQVVLTEPVHRAARRARPRRSRSSDSTPPTGRALLAAHAGAPVPERHGRRRHPVMLIFTSGTSGEPKAVQHHPREGDLPGRLLSERFGLGPDDVAYLSMPMFHSNAIMAGWGPPCRRARRSRWRGGSARPVSSTTCAGTGRRTPTTSASRSPTSWPRRSEPTTPTTRCGSCSATRPTSATSPSSAAGSAAWWSTPTPPPRTPWSCSAPRTCRRAVSAAPSTGSRCSTRRPCPRPPMRSSAPTAGCSTPTQATGELVNTQGAGAFAGYYNDPDAEAERMRGGHVLVRRPRLPRRGRLRLLRRTDGRLAAGRRREPRRGTGRADPAAPPGRLRGGRVRRSGRRPSATR